MTEDFSGLYVDVCVCTFRRTHVTSTLRSVLQLNVPNGVSVKIIIADNDDEPSAKESVSAFSPPPSPFSITYVHAPARNISVARNACLDHAKGSFVLFVDDDELVSSVWLEEMLAEQKRSSSDAVLGQVSSVYPPGTPSWISNGDFHSIQPVWVKGKIVTGYTSNLLLKRSTYEARSLRFDKRLGQSGGEDTVFLHELYKRGGKITYASEAIVTELVQENRLSLAWLAKRAFRSGQTHGVLVLSRPAFRTFDRVKSILVACMKAIFCFMMAFFALFTGAAPRWFLRGVLHIGVLGRLSGKMEIIQYG